MKYTWIDEYLLGKRGVEKDLQKDWNWIRYQVGGKMFAAVCLDEHDKPYYITFKLDPAEGRFLRSQYADIVPGYYMNKMHWNSVKPDGAVPDDLLKDLLDKSYGLVLGSFSRKRQKEILGGRTVMEGGEIAELWDVYTSDRVKTGRFHVRGQKMPQGDYHLVVHVCIFNSRNEMLIQRRQPFKHGWPNLWDLTVGGSALAGDTSRQAAERELFEELGLKVDLSGVRPKFSVMFSDGFDDYYLIRQDVDLSSLTLQQEEVQAVKWAGKEEVLRMQEAGTFIPYWFLDKLFDMSGWYDAFRNPDTAVKVQYADAGRLESWMSMVEIVRDNFPGLETQEELDDYRETVRNCMEKGTAVCALMGNIVVGVLLFSVKHNMLACMAVHPEFRRRHIASKMLELMLEKMDRERPVVVETFREGDARGVEARAFYKRMGFEEGELCLFRDSYPEQRFYLRKWEERNG